MEDASIRRCIASKDQGNRQSERLTTLVRLLRRWHSAASKRVIGQLCS